MFAWSNNLTLSIFLLVISSFAFEVVAHPSDASNDARVVVYQWASAVVNQDEALMNTLLSEQFAGPSSLGWASKQDHLNSVKKHSGAFFAETIKIELKHAFFRTQGEGISVSPIIIMFWDDANHIAATIDLAQEHDGWKIQSLSLVADLPSQITDSIVPKGLSAQTNTLPITFSLRGKVTDEPVFARVNIVDENGEYWPPRGHQKSFPTGWRQDVGGDVHIAGKNYAYVPSQFTADLPPGNYVVEVFKGMEYIPVSSSFKVSNDSNKNQEITISRWVNMAERGWYSGDTHTHFLNDYNALLEAQAEDLNVINVLATKWGVIVTNVEEVTGKPSPVSTSKHIVFFNEETRHGWLGHTTLHPIKEIIYPLSWGQVPSAGVKGGFDYPPMAYQADKAHSQGGIVTWAHFPGPSGELAIDVALGKVDSIDLFTWGDAFTPTLPIENNNVIPGPVSYWYKFLNTGFKLPATAGTDKMFNNQISGSVRTYAYLQDAEFEYSAWVDAVSQGRTLVTTGPMILFEANGEPVGSTLEVSPGTTVNLKASIITEPTLYPWDRFEIIQNGKVIASLTPDVKKRRQQIEVELEVNGSSWVAARSYSESKLPYQSNINVMAHTSPIYLEVKGQRIWSADDAAFLIKQCERAIKWAQNEARFYSEEQRREVIELYSSAKAIYERQ